MKVIIFDASTLITFAMNGLLPEFKELKKIFDGKFIITQDVKREAIDRPLTIKRFELEAMKLNKLLREKVLEMPSILGVNNEEILKGANKIMDISNTTFKREGKDIKIIDIGEATCLALSQILDEKQIKHLTAIDERTTRVLCERPENLQKLLQKKLHTKISFKKENFKFFKRCNIIRSSELIYLAYKKGLTRLKKGNVLDALLYAMQFKGCSISRDEIEEMKKLK